MTSMDVSFIIAFIHAKISTGNILKGLYNWKSFTFAIFFKNFDTLLFANYKINTIKRFDADAVEKIKHKTRL